MGFALRLAGFGAGRAAGLGAARGQRLCAMGASGGDALRALQAQVAAAGGAIFDNDGTLVDTMPAHFRAWRAAAAEHGLVFTEAEFYARAGATGAEIIAALNAAQGGEAPRAAVLASKRAHLEAEIAAVREIAVVAPLARYARQCGVPVAVASGGSRATVRASLTAAGFDPDKDFDTVVTAEDVVNGKPHPETFLLAAQRLGVDPERCVGFEDGDLGIQALEAAGMAAVDVRKIAGYPLPEILKSNTGASAVGDK